jgi:octaprenyl-diphosphate synthase
MCGKVLRPLVERDPTFLEEITLKTKDYLDRASIAIDRELERHSKSRFFGPLKYALEGGKRIRPMAIMLSAEAVGSKDDSILDAAVAVELLHAESIIHDDIIDQEVSRRGKAAFHVRYGYSASLLTADFVFSMILAIAARYKDKRVAHTLSNAALRMCEGEYMELTIDPMTYKLGWDEYVDIIYNKTAALFQTATELGGIIGGGTKQQIEALSNYGKYLGIAYQVHDDLLDWGAKDKVTMALKQSNEESSILSKLSSLTESYSKKAKEQLDIIADGRAKVLLRELTDFSVQRDF